MSDSAVKSFFIAGLAMENARERKEAAGREFRRIAAERCPEELALFDKMKGELSDAEKRFAASMSSMAEEQRHSAHAMLHAHGVQCGDRNCTMHTASLAPVSDDGNKASN